MFGFASPSHLSSLWQTQMLLRRQAAAASASPRHSLTRPQAFVQHYYAAFDAEATRPGLAALYQPSSMLTFEGSKLQVLLAARRA